MKKALLVLSIVSLLMFAAASCSSPSDGPDGPTAVVEDFEGYSINDVLGEVAWGDANITATVVADPLGVNGNVLQVVTTDYNSAPVIPITLPAGIELSQYSSVTVSVIWASGDVTFKDVLVYAFAAAPTGAFYNDSQMCTTSNYIGLQANSVAAADATAWAAPLNIAITGGALTGTVYFPIGFNSDDATYYLDNITLNP